MTEHDRRAAWRRALQSVGMAANSQHVAELLDLAAGLSDSDLVEFMALVHSRAAAHDMRAPARPAGELLN